MAFSWKPELSKKQGEGQMKYKYTNTNKPFMSLKNSDLSLW